MDLSWAEDDAVTLSSPLSSEAANHRARHFGLIPPNVTVQSDFAASKVSVGRFFFWRLNHSQFCTYTLTSQHYQAWFWSCDVGGGGGDAKRFYGQVGKQHHGNNHTCAVLGLSSKGAAEPTAGSNAQYNQFSIGFP